MKSQKTPKPADVHVGQRVRMRRMMLKMSQETLAEHLGVTFQQIQKYENGKNRVSASRLVEMAAALNVEPAFFFEGLEIASDMTAGDQAMMTAASVPGALDLLEAYQRMPEKCRRGFLMSARGLMEAA